MSLMNMMCLGSKALSNMSQQFSKLNKLGQSFNIRRRRLGRNNTITTADSKVSTCYSVSLEEHFFRF